jgi:hypothetical protein
MMEAATISMRYPAEAAAQQQTLQVPVLVVAVVEVAVRKGAIRAAAAAQAVAVPGALPVQVLDWCLGSLKRRAQRP